MKPSFLRQLPGMALMLAFALLTSGYRCDALG